MDSSNENPDIGISDDGAELLVRLEADRRRELTDEEANLAVAQAQLIGDL